MKTEHDDDFTYDEFAYHAPTEFVYAQHAERERRKRRDREDLQDTWRDEVLRRKREHAARFLKWGGGR